MAVGGCRLAAGLRVSCSGVHVKQSGAIGGRVLQASEPAIRPQPPRPPPAATTPVRGGARASAIHTWTGCLYRRTCNTRATRLLGGAWWLTRGEAPLRSEPLLAITGQPARAAQPRSPQTTPCGPMGPRQGGWRPCGLVAGHALRPMLWALSHPALQPPLQHGLPSTPAVASHAQTTTANTSLQRHKARRAPRPPPPRLPVRPPPAGLRKKPT